MTLGVFFQGDVAGQIIVDLKVGMVGNPVSVIVQITDFSTFTLMTISNIHIENGIIWTIRAFMCRKIEDLWKFTLDTPVI